MPFSKITSVCILACLMATASEIKSTAVFQRDNTGKPVPRFMNGYAVYYDRQAATVTWYLIDGTAKGETKLTLPETSRINIIDVCARKDGTIAVAATALSQDSDRSVPVIFWLRPDGTVGRIVRTSPFVSLRILFSPGGNLWAVGKVNDAAYRETPRHDILQEFDQVGKFVRSALPVGDFAGVPGHPALQAILVGNGATLGLYSPQTDDYIELDWQGTVKSRSRILAVWPKSTSIVGATLTATGALYVGGVQSGSAPGPVLYRLDRAQAKFAPVEVPRTAGPLNLVTLLASEGDDLLFYAKPSGVVRISAMD